MERNSPNGLQQPLLGQEEAHIQEKGDENAHIPVTGYENASAWSRVTFAWLNPVLQDGATKTIDIDDVPALSRRHRATNLYERFISNWPETEDSNSTARTLWATFWWPIVYSGLLALVRLSVIYVGPLLINSFVDYTAGKSAFPYEGCVLVFILIFAKAVETTSTHMYQFTCNKLGLQVRSSLISTIYRKGLRLSSSARQSHGVGQIVNYMSVDVQQLSDVCIQMHNLWFIPLQFMVAVLILWTIVGVSTLAGLAVMLFTALSNVGLAKFQKRFQTEIMEGRDLRIKAFNEALNNMKVWSCIGMHLSIN